LPPAAPLRITPTPSTPPLRLKPSTTTRTRRLLRTLPSRARRRSRLSAMPTRPPVSARSALLLRRPRRWRHKSLRRLAHNPPANEPLQRSQRRPIFGGDKADGIAHLIGPARAA